MNDRNQILNEINNLLETFCHDCFIKKLYRKEYGKNVAQSFCLHQCTVGEVLQQYGNKLINKNG